MAIHWRWRPVAGGGGGRRSAAVIHECGKTILSLNKLFVKNERKIKITSYFSLNS
jgi:hypothetical protein